MNTEPRPAQHDEHAPATDEPTQHDEHAPATDEPNKAGTPRSKFMAALKAQWKAHDDGKDNKRLARYLAAALLVVGVLTLGVCIRAGIIGGAKEIAGVSGALTGLLALVGSGCRLWAHGLGKEVPGAVTLDGFGKGLAFFAAAAGFVFAFAAWQLAWP